MTWDPVTGRTLLFSAESELWAWDGASWELLDDGRGTAPSPRDDAQLVVDAGSGVLWLHGGRSEAGGTVQARSDTWRWEGSWHLVVADGSAGAPPPRIHPVSTWDGERSRMLLVGGTSLDETFLGDAWAWDGSAWTQLPSAWPPGRVAAMDIARDPSSGELVTLTVDLDAPADGELYPSRLLGWADDGTWRVVADGPSFSPIQPMVATRRGLLLVDGGAGQGASITWTWDGERWARATGDGPSPRNGQVLAYDAARDVVVLFGGHGGGRDLADLWEWDGSRWVERRRPD